MEHRVRVHIDQRPHESPNPTTGAALYALGGVVGGPVLYREVAGDREDNAVPNGPERVHLREDEHFHSGPATIYRIVVNGQERRVTGATVTYEEIVALAFPAPPVGQNVMYTVSYDDGPRVNRSGSLTAGRKVTVKDGMIFNVTATDRS